jgi:hypothetical protein
MIKKFFKKVFKKFKKILSPIGKELKRGLKGVGKFFGKLGPIGTLALSLMLPGIGSALTSFGAWAGVGAGAAAPFSGTIFGPLGKVIQGVAKVGAKAGEVFGSVSEFVGSAVNNLTGGKAGEFSNWVSNKLDKTRQMFGLETSMDQTTFDSTLAENSEALKNIKDVNELASIPTQTPTTGGEMFGAETTTRGPLSEEELFAKAEQESLLSSGAPEVKQQTLAEMYPDRKTIEVPVGYKENVPASLEQLNNAGSFKENPFKMYELETKTVFEDSLTPEQLDLINTDDVEYFAKFNNNRVGKADAFVKNNYMKDGEFTAEYSDLLKNPKDLEGQMLRQDVGAMAAPASVVSSMLTPDVPVQTGGSTVQVTPLPTDTDVQDYQNSVGQTYAALGYKGPNTLEGYTMFGGYGNTPMNFMNQYTQRVIQPSMTIAMPQLS